VNRNGKCEGLGEGDQRGALCIEFTLVLYNESKHERYPCCLDSMQGPIKRGNC